MARTLVIGFGSDLRRDDAVGRRVAEEVEARSLGDIDIDAGIDIDIDVIVTTQLVPELIEAISTADCVVFVDASVSVLEVTVAPIQPLVGAGSSHHATPGGLLGLAERLGLDVPSAFLVEIPAHDLSLGQGLSDETAAFVDGAVADVLAIARARPRLDLGDLPGQEERTMTASPRSVAVRPNGSTSARRSSGDQHR